MNAAFAKSSDYVGHAVAAIARLIREQDLKPGDRLPAETVLSSQLQVSRTVVREALRSLAALSLLELGAGKRPTVAKLDDEALCLMIDHGVMIDQIDIQQIYDARRTIEVRTAALAALRRTDAEAIQIIAHATAMAQDLLVPDKVMEHDIAFHLAVARASRNPLFALILGAFQNVTRETWPIGWRSRSSDAERQAMNALHLELAEAIAAGNPQSAAAMMERHFDSSLKALVAAGII
ncbi:DNA-binding FadR family transcriptional regulator [Pseudorhizobium tarimense]|uniref:DNA-binding FadR family transcriptional regulator n=1 Tax=Pseudorhizobium tarimense TaxID=1079109 RepID=A0ABV2H4L6_9HYPH|nr:FadR/GntR family transcriptional regulator [Pseudorhizobium tarimense]MCJ8518701.1 FadR family transcriptional regulator [Pseudorhizobium tarimense]